MRLLNWGNFINYVLSSIENGVPMVSNCGDVAIMKLLLNRLMTST